MKITRSSAIEYANIAYDIVAQRAEVTVDLLQQELMRIMMCYDYRGRPDITYKFPVDFLEEIIRERRSLLKRAENENIASYCEKFGQ